MKIIKQAFMAIRQNFTQLVLTQFLFLAVNFFYALFLRMNIAGYLAKLDSTYSSISVIQNMTDTVVQNKQLESLVSTLEPSTRSTVILAFIITPIILLVAWILFQGIIWKILNKKNIKSTKLYFIQFSVMTVAASLLASLILYRIKSTTLMVIFMFIVYYFLTVAYSMISSKTMIEATGALFIQGIKNFHLFAPYILLLFITSIFQSVIFIMLFISFSQKTSAFISPILLVLYTLIVLLLTVFLKAVVAQRIQQHAV